MDIDFRKALQNWRNEHARMQHRFKILKDRNKNQVQEISLHLQKVRENISQSSDCTTKEDSCR